MDKGKRPRTSGSAFEEFDWIAFDRKMQEMDKIKKNRKRMKHENDKLQRNIKLQWKLKLHENVN